ncbi:MAG: hypothetical protein Roseis2KO_41640 [Roseivirga sp.]
MKKTVLRIIALVLVIISIDLAWGPVFDRVRENQKSGEFGFINHTFYETTDDILIIGSSRAESNFVSLDMEEQLGLTVWNAGMNGQILPYWYALMSKVIERHTPKAVIININPLSLTQDPDISAYDRAAGLLRPYYGSNTGIDTIVNRASKYEQYLVKSNLYRYNSTYLHFINSYLTGNEKLENKGWKTKKKSIKKGQYQEHNLIYNRISKESMRLMESLIKKLKSKGIKVIVVVSPTYNANVAHSNSIEQLKTSEGIDVINFANHSIRTNHQFFKDRTHLNVTGAKRFTYLTSEEIKRLRILD